MTPAELSQRDYEHGVRISILEERLRNADQQLKEQKVEYERRLSELNHAGMQRDQRESDFISTDKFDGFVSDTSKWRAGVDKTLSTIEGRSGGLGSARVATQQIWMIAVLTLGVIVALAVAIWK